MTTTIRTVVRPGGLIQITVPEWAEGQTVDITISEPVPSEKIIQPPKGVWDYLQNLPALERTPEEWAEIERQFQVERNSWDR